jgi:autotransporter-associated beta strand protein
MGGSEALTLSGGLTLTGFKSLTVTNSAATTFSGSVGESSPSILIKQGAGELRLNGANTYSGGTFIQAGTVRINNSSGSAFGTGAVTVGAGATLAGAGSFSGALQLNGTFSPGNSPGTTNTGSQTWAGGGRYVWEVRDATPGGAGTQWDLLSISGSLTIAATSGNPFTVELRSLGVGDVAGAAANFNPAQSYSFTLAATTSGISGFSGNAFTVDTAGFSNSFAGTWAVAQSGSNLMLNYSASAVPEPATYAALAGAVMLGFAAWRRRAAR